MADNPHVCDSYRLRLSLEDRLSDAEQTALASHLETCAGCRQELERLAAASQLWGDARLLRGEAEPGATPTIGLAHGTLEPDDDHTDSDAEGGAWIDFLDPPDPDRPETLGRLGAYQVLKVLGQGGMGVVLKALDPALDRTVAIKVLAPNLAHGATARRRFEREARAAAAVGHEHIVAIHAVSEFRGLPYIVMQYIPGRSLQERLDASGPLSVKEILRIGTQAARALAAAHAQGVVHRDIKPANILLENCIERVKLSDFGLARAIDDASLTQSGVIAGTPQYMAPEQARGEPVDARSDLFSLGAVLYAMAGGRPPFRADSAMAVLKRVCDDRHRSIRELNSDVPDWLEAIIDRLLAKEPADRFQTAAEVADLLERGLAHVQQPTAVPRPSIPGLQVAALANLDFDVPVAKTPHRSRRRLAVAASFALLALAGLGASEAAGLTQVTDFVATILRIKTPEGTLVVKVDDPGVKVDVDNEVVIIGGAGPQEIRLRTGLHRVQATRNGQPVKDELISIMKGKKEIVAIGYEATAAATLGTFIDRQPPAPQAPRPPIPVTATVGTAVERKPMTAPPSHVEQCMACHKVSDALDRSWPPNHPTFNLGKHSIPFSNTLLPGSGNPGRSIGTRGLVWSIAFSPDGRRLAIGQQGMEGQPSALRMWDVAAKKEVFSTLRPSAFRCVAFSPDGKKLAAGTFDCAVELYRIEGDVAKLDGFWKDLGEPINALGFQRDARGDLVAGNWAGKLLFFHSWRVESVQFDCGKIFTMAFSPDGSTLAVAGSSGAIQLYEIESGRKLATPKGHEMPVESLDFSPDGKHLASASWDKTVRIWEVASGREERRLAHSVHERLAVRFSPDGKLLACADGEHEKRHFEPIPDVSVQLWDWAQGTLLHALSGHTNCVYSLAFSPDGKTLASGSMDQTIKLWDTATGQLRETIVPGESGNPSRVGAVSSDRNLSNFAAEMMQAVPPTPAVPSTPALPTSPASPLAQPEVMFPQGDKEAGRRPIRQMARP